jgi:transcriptional regulator with XRE-family HTH domain
MPKKIDPVDILVGKNVRVFRLAKGLSQTELGTELGITFQQIQKYEKGFNRVGSGRLARISKVLEVPIERLFGGSTDTHSNATDIIVTDLLAAPYALRVLKALSKIKDAEVRRSIVALTETIATRSKG